MSDTHPTIQFFGKTDSGPFPLILAIGREPNTKLPIVDTIGPYDFREVPYCGFWNISYSMLGRLGGLSTREFKSLCVKRHASPLVYADALPHALANEAAGKQAIRRAIPSEAARAHVGRVFSHRQLLDRVKVVILSGVDSETFHPATQAFRRHSAAESIRVIDLPFFYGTNTPEIERRLTNDDRAALKAVLDAFEVQTR